MEVKNYTPPLHLHADKAITWDITAAPNDQMRITCSLSPRVSSATPYVDFYRHPREGTQPCSPTATCNATKTGVRIDPILQWAYFFFPIYKGLAFPFDNYQPH